MNIITQAESDLSFILEDSENGFGVVLSFLDNSNELKPVTCQTTDIGYFVDMNTGAAVTSRTVECTARISTLRELNIPEITNLTLITYTTTNGVSYKLRVIKPFYDRKLGVIRMTTELVK